MGSALGSMLTAGDDDAEWHCPGSSSGPCSDPDCPEAQKASRHNNLLALEKELGLELEGTRYDHHELAEDDARRWFCHMKEEGLKCKEPNCRIRLRAKTWNILAVQYPRRVRRGNLSGDPGGGGASSAVLQKGGIGAGNEAGRDNNLQLVRSDVQEMVKEKQTIGSGNYAGGSNVTQTEINYNNVYMLPPCCTNAPCDTELCSRICEPNKPCHGPGCLNALPNNYDAGFRGPNPSFQRPYPYYRANFQGPNLYYRDM